MVLVDTTVWVDFFRGISAPHVEALESSLAHGDDVCTCGVVLTETLQGIREEKDYQLTKEFMGSLIYFPMTRDTFLRAADLYRSLRRQGVAIRKPVDCMIAVTAMENDVPLLHNDKDFDQIRMNCKLKVWQA